MGPSNYEILNFMGLRLRDFFLALGFNLKVMGLSKYGTHIFVGLSDDGIFRTIGLKSISHLWISQITVLKDLWESMTHIYETHKFE